jgi:Domain of unknown function (DUF222)/HNH endonuclease
MDSNTHSDRRPAGPPAGCLDRLAALTAAVEDLVGEDLDRLPDATIANSELQLRRLLDRLEGHWLKGLATLDARGAAGAEADVQVGSTAGWLRQRLGMSANAAHSAVRTARAVFRGPLPQTAQALTDGTISPAHASVLAHGTHDLPAHLTAEAEPVLLEAAQRLDPGRLRQVVGHLCLVADPDGADHQAERRHGRRELWLASTWEGMVAINGLLEPEAGQTLLAALEPLARPANAEDTRSGGQRQADALTELARRSLEHGRLSQTGGVRPQLTVVVDLDTLQSGTGLGGQTDLEVLAPEGCRRLACDGAVTRVLVTRHPTTHHHGACRHQDHDALGGDGGLAARLQTAAALLPPVLGGAPSQPLDVGRTSRVVTPAQRSALAVRDGGCVFPGCQRPLAWCEGHHLIHWLHGGPTDLGNLVLLCRAHHRAVHEGGWQLTRGPDGRLTATPPQRHHRRQHAAA